MFEGVLTITLSDEERRNALSSDLVHDLVSACDEADVDPSVRVVVVTNTGSTFCAGANLAERSTSKGRSAAVVDPEELFGRFAR